MKRRVAIKAGRAAAQPQRKKRALGDDAFDWGGAKGGGDVIASDSDESGADAAPEGSDSEEDEREARETAQEKRVRLAKEYLEQVKTQEAGSDEDEDGEEDDSAGVEDRVGARLHQDALEAAGRLFKEVASKYEEFEFDADSTKFLKGHRVRPSCARSSATPSMALLSGSNAMWLRSFP